MKPQISGSLVSFLKLDFFKNNSANLITATRLVALKAVADEFAPVIKVSLYDGISVVGALWRTGYSGGLMITRLRVQ